MKAAAETDLSAERGFRRIFEVEYRPDGSFLLKSKRTGEVVAAGFTGKRSAELPLEERR